MMMIPVWLSVVAVVASFLVGMMLGVLGALVKIGERVTRVETLMSHLTNMVGQLLRTAAVSPYQGAIP